MTIPLNAEYPVPVGETYDLHDLAGKLVDDVKCVAEKNQTTIINDIPVDLYLGTDPGLVAEVLSDLLHSMTFHAKDSCIHLSAKLYSDVVLLHVKDCSTFNSYALDSGLQRLQPIVEKMGGFLNITSLRKKVTTVAFCFPNLPLAA